VNLFRRARPALAEDGGTFGEWLLGLFADGKRLADLPFSEVERLCANAASLLVGAAYAVPGHFTASVAGTRDAALVARRTADGFQASLADKQNTALAWPWDHMATTVAWGATRDGNTSEAALGRALSDLGSAYALRHREQAAAVLGLWQEVASGVRAGAPRPDLARMGSEMLAAYQSAAVRP
jgi:hypothetical protein